MEIRNHQFELIQIGVFLGQDDTSLDMSMFKDLEDVRLYLNAKYSINIQRGMPMATVLNEIEQGIHNSRFGAGMSAI